MPSVCSKKTRKSREAPEKEKALGGRSRRIVGGKLAQGLCLKPVSEDLFRAA